MLLFCLYQSASTVRVSHGYSPSSNLECLVDFCYSLTRTFVRCFLTNHHPYFHNSITLWSKLRADLLVDPTPLPTSQPANQPRLQKHEFSVCVCVFAALPHLLLILLSQPSSQLQTPLRPSPLRTLPPSKPSPRTPLRTTRQNHSSAMMMFIRGYSGRSCTTKASPSIHHEIRLSTRKVWMPHSTTALRSVCATSLLAQSAPTGSTASRVGSVSEPRLRRPRREGNRLWIAGGIRSQSPVLGSGRSHGSSRRPHFVPSAHRFMDFLCVPSVPLQFMGRLSIFTASYTRSCWCPPSSLPLRLFRLDLLLSMGPLLDFPLEPGFLDGLNGVHSLLYVCIGYVLRDFWERWRLGCRSNLHICDFHAKPVPSHQGHLYPVLF